MDDIDRSINYFTLFTLSMEKSRENNYKTLEVRLEELRKRRDEDSKNKHKLAQKAASQIFAHDAEYKEYLRYWKDKEQGAGNTEKQKQLEEELRRVKEVQKRYQTDAQEAKRRVEKAQAEAAKLREKEAEEAARQAQAELDLQSSKPASKSALELLADVGKYAFGHQSKPSGWQLIGDIANHINTKQNPQIKPSPKQQPVTDQQRYVDLRGDWKGPSDLVWTFKQQSNQLSVQAKLPHPLAAVVIRLDLTGIVFDRQVQLSGSLYFVGKRFDAQANFTLTEDESRLEGELFGNGQTYSLILYR